jgi:hypothetical protein
MLKRLLDPMVKDICPNCGTACTTTDVLCPRCGENLDELFEQLPGPKETYDLFKKVAKNLSFLNWLTPLLLLLSPLIVSVITVLHVALYRARILDYITFEWIGYAVLDAVLVSSGFLLISVTLLCLSTTSFMRAKIGQRPVAILATVFSILSGIALWFGLSTANIRTASHFRVGFGELIPAAWVYLVIAGGIVLIILNLMIVIEKGRAA